MRAPALLAALLAILATACGPKTLANDPPPAPPSNEPWVKDHVATVEAACECETSACLQTAKAKIDALEAEHGGLDESPADIHKSRGKFEECYRTGTVDPVRDLAAVADAMCRCTDPNCVDKGQIARLDYDEKYASVALAEGQRTEIAELAAKYDECKKTKIVSAAVIATHVERVTGAVCACASGSGCGLELTSLEMYPTAPKVIDYTDEVKDRVKSAMERLCNCAQNGQLYGTYGGINTVSRCPKPEK